MLITKKQFNWFWSMAGWPAIVALHGWTNAEGEEQRRLAIQRAGFPSGSLKDVDHLEGFDRLKAEMEALKNPADIDPQMRQAQMPRTRLEFAVGQLSQKLSPSNDPLAYARAISRDRFGTLDIGSLTDGQLEQLRNTLRTRERAHNKAKTHEPIQHAA